MAERELQLGLAMIVAATVGLAFKGIIARLAYGAGMSVDMLLVLRFTAAAPLFWLIHAAAPRGGSRRRMNARDWADCALNGLLFFVAAYCDFTAVAMVGASLSRIVLFTFPALVLLLEWATTGKRPTGQQLSAFGLSYAGLVLVILPASGGDTAANPIGFLFSFGSALSYAVFWHRSQRLTRALGSIRFNAVSNTVTLGCMLLFLLPALGPSDLRFSAAAAGWVAVIVVFCTVVPFFLMFEGVRRVGAAEAGLVTLFGPAVTVAAAWALLGEQLSALQLAGFGAVTLGMAALRGIANAPARLIAGFFRPRAAVKQPDEH